MIPSPFADEIDTLKEIESLIGQLPSSLRRHMNLELVERMAGIEIDGLPLKPFK